MEVTFLLVIDNIHAYKNVYDKTMYRRKCSIFQQPAGYSRGHQGQGQSGKHARSGDVRTRWIPNISLKLDISTLNLHSFDR